MSEHKKESPFSRTCKQAAALEKWAVYLFAGFIILALINLISSGIYVEMDRYTVLRKFSIGEMLSNKSVIQTAALLLGGYIISLLLSSLSVIVEASYRSMKDE